MDSHLLWRAACDLRLPSDASVLLITQNPERWDECLDTRLPLLISSTVGSWERLGADLWEAGCSPVLTLRLVESDGEVRVLSWVEQTLVPEPRTQVWTLAVGWSHPEEGWRAKRALHGQTYLVTRAEGQGQGLISHLEELGATVYSVPTIAFTEPDDFHPWVSAVSTLESFDWIVFTSPNGVDSFIERLRQSGRDLRVLGNAKFACIGPSTAKALARHTLVADLIPEEYVAEGLVAALLTELGPDLSGKRFLLPRAQVARTVLPDTLRKAGAEVLVAPVYKTVPPTIVLPEIETGRQPHLLFTSSSTVTNWIESTPLRFPCFCIGPITAQTALESGLEVQGIADIYTIDGLISKILESNSALQREDTAVGKPFLQQESL